MSRLRTPLRFTLTLATLAATKIFITDNLYEPTSITGVSMSPTLNPDFSTTGALDVVLWRKFNPTVNLRRGDIVHFKNPHAPEDCAVKRVIALPGDTVVLDPRRRPSRRRDGADVVESGRWDFMAGRDGLKVPEGHVWVEGDNWRKTVDSNWYGPISKSLITGRALMLVRPLGKFGGRPWESWEGAGGTRVVEGTGEGRRGDLEALERVWYG